MNSSEAKKKGSRSIKLCKICAGRKTFQTRIRDIKLSRSLPLTRPGRHHINYGELRCIQIAISMAWKLKSQWKLQKFSASNLCKSALTTTHRKGEAISFIFRVFYIKASKLSWSIKSNLFIAGFPASISKILQSSKCFHSSKRSSIIRLLLNWLLGSWGEIIFGISENIQPMRQKLIGDYRKSCNSRPSKKMYKCREHLPPNRFEKSKHFWRLELRLKSFSFPFQRFYVAFSSDSSGWRTKKCASPAQRIQKAEKS